MILARYEQTPDEVKIYGVDYIEWLDRDGLVAEDISSVIVTASPVTVPPLAVTAAVLINTTAIAVTAQGGLLDSDYTVKIQITTSTPQVKEDCIEIGIRSACA